MYLVNDIHDFRIVLSPLLGEFHVHVTDFRIVLLLMFDFNLQVIVLFIWSLTYMISGLSVYLWLVECHGHVACNCFIYLVIDIHDFRIVLLPMLDDFNVHVACNCFIYLVIDIYYFRIVLLTIFW